MSTIDVSSLAARLYAELAAILGPGQVLNAPEDLAVHARDQWRQRRGYGDSDAETVLPLAVARPLSTADVAAVLAIASRLGVPVVQLGGGTGLMGGARTVRPGIVLDTRSLNRVLTVAPEARMVTVEAGAVLAEVNAALAPHGQMLGHDPWTVPIATVGGTISTNGLGYLGGRYGGIADQVLGLEVVLADGRVLTTRAVARSSTGPNLHRLFTGAEGSLGVITSVTLRTFPLPEQRLIQAFDLPSFATGLAAAQEMFCLGLSPAMLDFGAPPADEGRLYLGFDGLREEVAALAGRARQVVVRHGGKELAAEVGQGFWQGRHVYRDRLVQWRTAERNEPVPGTPGSTVTDYLHVALPAPAVPPLIEAVERLCAQRSIHISEWGLWHGPELLSLVVHRRTDTPADLHEMRDGVDRILMLVQDAGGSMEYVHGAGLRYAHLMEREHGESLSLLRSIKGLLDPQGLLNPDKLGL